MILVLQKPIEKLFEIFEGQLRAVRFIGKWLPPTERKFSNISIESTTLFDKLVFYLLFHFLSGIKCSMFRITGS